MRSETIQPQSIYAHGLRLEGCLSSALRSALLRFASCTDSSTYSPLRASLNHVLGSWSPPDAQCVYPFLVSPVHQNRQVT